MERTKGPYNIGDLLIIPGGHKFGIIIDEYNDYFNFFGGRDMAYDDKQKKKKKGIYRESYYDNNDIDNNDDNISNMSDLSDLSDLSNSIDNWFLLRKSYEQL